MGEMGGDGVRWVWGIRQEGDKIGNLGWEVGARNRGGLAPGAFCCEGAGKGGKT